MTFGRARQAGWQTHAELGRIRCSCYFREFVVDLPALISAGFEISNFV